MKDCITSRMSSPHRHDRQDAALLSARRALGLGLWLLMILLLVAPSAQAQSLDANAQAFWDRDWSYYAARYVKRDGEFYACAKYHPGFPSSQGTTAAKLIELHTQRRTVTLSANVTRQVITIPNQTDARLGAAALPAVTPGEYGTIHSAEIVQIIGPQEVLLKQAWLINAQTLKQQISDAKVGPRDTDRDQETEFLFQFRQQMADRQREEESFRKMPILLKGISTAGLREGLRWTGPQGQGLDIAITGIQTISYTPSPRSSSRTRQSAAAPRTRQVQVAVALPATAFRGRISKEEFNELLASRNMTLPQFIELAIEHKKKDAANAVANTILDLEARKPASPAGETEDLEDESEAPRSPQPRRSRSVRP